MPELSRFFGIIIAMFYDDHNPPHFHARYGEYKASIRIEDFAVLDGYLPPRALGLVMEWAGMHKDELLVDWKLVKENKRPAPIEPLT
ncbi:MAG TPA: transcriptional regulator [Bdellovibrionales bacterium]|nr:transcriptional regulator [Bdellovibrionales bacterium]HAS53010.1 transcriptional regulator [Nitrospiraceae bacterium]